MTKLLALLCVLSASSTFAASPAGVPVVNIYTGATPFVIVSKGTKAKPAGLYRAGAGGNLVVPGPLLKDSHGDVFIRQLSLAKNDGRAYALVVSDGFLRLVTNVSDANDSETLLTFGSPSTPLVDVGSGQKRSLPKITSTANIAVYASDSTTGNHQAVLVSLKFDESTPIGDAVTFAFTLKPLEGDGNKISLHGTPMLLDSKFHSAQKLSRLLSEPSSTGEKLVYSQNLVDQIEHSIPATDPDLIERMGDHWRAFTNWFDAQIKLVRDKPSFATLQIAYDLNARRPVRNITFERDFDNGVFKQRFDPAKGTGQIQIHLPRRFAVYQDGFLDMNGTEGLISRRDGSALFSADGKLHFAFVNATGNTKIVELPFESSVKVQRLSFRLIESEANTGAKTRSLLYSVQYGAQFADQTGSTNLVSIVEHSPQVASVSEPTVVYDRFLPTDLLEARVQHASTGHWMFDSATAWADNPEAYRLLADTKAAKLNISLSAGREPIYEYTSALKEINFEPGLTLAFFQEMPNVPNASGLFASKEKLTGAEKNAIRGQILVRKDQDEKILELPRERFPITRISYQVADRSDSALKKSERTAYVFAIDPNHKDGRESFLIAVASNLTSNAPEDFHIRYAKPDTYGYDQLYAVKAVRGRGPNKERLFVFTSFMTQGKRGVTRVIPINLKTDPSSFGAARPITESIQITDQPLSDTEIEKRVLYSEEGLPYFVKTPQYDRTSAAYEVFDLVNAEVVKPAIRTGKNKISFVLNADKHFADGEEQSWSDRIDQRIRWTDWPEDFVVRAKSTWGAVDELSRFESFRELMDELDRMVTPNAKPQQRILVVPAQLRDLVSGFVGALFMQRRGELRTGFSAGNDQLELSVFDKNKNHQDYIFANIESMASAPRRKQHPAQSFLVARMDDVLKTERPKAKDGETFMLQELTSSGLSSPTGVDAQTDSKPPYALYLLAAGGPVSIESFRKSPPPPKFSSLIIATPEEMSLLETNAALEIDSGLLNAFEVSEIKNPDTDSMTASIKKIFENEELRSQGYKFSASEIRKNIPMTADEHENTVLEYAISRFQRLVTQKNGSLFESFMRFRSAFANAVLTDRAVRRSRLIDKFFVERVLTQVFDIPINLNTLPDDDPLKILARKDAALKLYETGYWGPFDLKRKLIKTILSQTQADAGKKIPSSMIFFGRTGSGKTYFFEKLMKMLGVKPYSFKVDADNREAGYIIVNVGKLTSGSADNGSAEGLGVDSAIKHLNTFIQLPYGFRGFVLIDDGHANTDEIRGKILGWERGLFEANDGILRVGSTSRPVRNLNLIMTLNPTTDQDQIAKFAVDKKAPTLEETLLATLSTTTFKVEPSFLRRWGRIEHVDYMPPGAQGPELIEKLGEASRDQLTTSGRVGLVDPKVIEQIVRQSEKLDARTFLSASVSTLMHSINEAQLNGSIAMVIPKNPRYTVPVTSSSAIPDNGITPAEKLSDWVAKNTRVISLDGSLEGRLSHLRLIVDAYRIPVYEFMVNAISEDPRFTEDPLSQTRILAPVLMAIHDHIRERGSVPVSALPLLARDFDMQTASERTNFREVIARMSEHDKPFFPIQIASEGQFSTWDDLLGKTNDSREMGRGRRDVLFDTMVGLRSLMKDQLNRVMQVPDFEAADDPTRWLKSLEVADSTQMRSVGKGLSEAIWHYLPAVFDDNLIESRNGLTPINTYVAARMFMYAVDRAIVDLPWVKVNKFLLKSLELVAQDQVLSQKPGIQTFLFSNRYRLVKPTTPDLINEIIKGSEAYQNTTPQLRRRLADEFSADCEKYLLPIENGTEVTQ